MQRLNLETGFGACDAAVQCSLSSGTSFDHSSGSQHVLWMQKTILRNGQFVNVRELGVQTNLNPEEGKTADIVNSIRRGGHTSDVIANPQDVRREQVDVACADESLPAGFALTDRSRDLAELDQPRSLAPRTTSKSFTTAEETQQYVFELTNGARERACATAEHVEDLKHTASAALMDARRFQSEFNPSHAYESPRASRRHSDRAQSFHMPASPRSGRLSGRAQSFNATSSTARSQTKESEMHAERCQSNNSSSAATAVTLPELNSPTGGESPRRRTTTTKMPWQDLQAAMAGVPDASLGCKLMKIGTEPWRPKILSELQGSQSLRERLATSATIYRPTNPQDSLKQICSRPSPRASRQNTLRRDM